MEFPFGYAVTAVIAMLLSGLLGSVESALTPISRARVETMVKEDTPGARALLRVVHERAAHVNTLVMLRTILDVMAAVFAAMLAMDLIESDTWAITAAVATVTLLQFGIIGVFARTAGKRNPYSISLRAAQGLSLFQRVLGPVSNLLIRVGNLFHPGADFRDGPYATEVELREMVGIAQERGVVETTEGRMIQNIFDLASTHARQVMVPRPEMIWIEEDKTAAQATRLMVRCGHSRVPVIGETVDDVVGIAYLKDMFADDGAVIDPDTPIIRVVREPLFIPDSKPLDVLLREMQRVNTHIAIIIDEYGGVAGLLTMEDLLEEIVGDIDDEYDADEPEIEKVSDNIWYAKGTLSIKELNTNLGSRLDEAHEDYDTLGGLLYFLMGRIPEDSEQPYVYYQGIHFMVEEIENKRFARVRIEYDPEEQDEDSETEDKERF